MTGLPLQHVHNISEPRLFVFVLSHRVEFCDESAIGSGSGDAGLGGGGGEGCARTWLAGL